MQPLAEDRNGNQLIEFILGGEEPTISPAEADIPLVFTMVLAQYQGKIVMVYNRSRQSWELPGGGIDPGETIYDCAKREFFEESNQQLTNLKYLARGKFYVPNISRKSHPEHTVFAALFTADVETVVPFVVNNEMDDMALWDRKAILKGEINPIDLKILELVLPS